MSMDPLLENLKTFKWALADQDESSYQEIKRRIATSGKMRKLLTYSELVKGIDFQIGSINNGKSFRMNIRGWTDLDRHIIGQFLGKLSCETYENHGFMANVLVVDATEGVPSKKFFAWMDDVNAISDKSEKEMLSFWADHLRLAQQWYRRNG